MKMFKEIIVTTVAVMLVGAAFAAEHPTAPEKKGTGLLDGKTFVGDMGTAEDQQGHKDTLIFKDGTFTSTACMEYGFKAAPYKAEEKDGKIMFSVKGQNADMETMTWHGTIMDDQCEAAAVHESEAGKTEYWYKGARKAKGKKTFEHPHAEHSSSEHPH